MARTADVENVSRARRRSLLRVIARSPYWKCFICTLLIGICILYGAWCHIKHTAYSAMSVLKYQHGPCAQGYNFIPIVFGIMLYIVYIMECWHSRMRHSKIKKVSLPAAQEYVSSMRTAQPIVWWRALCYHYLRRTRQVTRYRNGDAISATQVYYERVNSHTAGNVFLYDVCGAKDISKNVLGIEDFAVTRIKVSRGFVFACMQAASEFEEQRTRFFNENEARDDYMEVREGMDLSNVNFDDELLCFKSDSPPWFLRPAVFWIFSIFCLSWPLRIFAEWRTAFLSYHVTKLFGTNYLSPSSVNYTGPLTRTSTMESAELSMILRREQFFVVPSYSQAMLVTPANANVVLMAPARAAGGFFGRNPRVSNNENVVIRNYGAIDENEPSPETGRAPPRSRSMSFFTRSGRAPPLRSHPVRSDSSRRPSRSLSIGGLSAAVRGSSWSNGFGWSSGRDSDPDRTPLLPDEPPPSYEVALRMCAPLYERVRRSISSRLNSLSMSSSKDLKHITNPQNDP